MKIFGRADTPERPASCTSEEYERLMKAIGRMDAQVESLATKWMLWKKEGDRLLARLERRDQRQKARTDQPTGDQEGENDIDRRIRARRGNALLG